MFERMNDSVIMCTWDDMAKLKLKPAGRISHVNCSSSLATYIRAPVSTPLAFTMWCNSGFEFCWVNMVHTLFTGIYP